ncbi:MULTISPECIES: hypothetical protein [Clostridium]|uniref:Uncharacterized protein n=1 Tax=Clostridium aquiflavi TaxID=3073603 RepID=A0ABU1EGJ8_9CLOT|nr:MULTISPECIES: hypothetical protein [unclassified Clostridium]MDR5587516.1 hypothetical protein [Clostridium sp. 5N-1]NFG62979.1 hypothetical protein [Clostridium botulinum]NFQ09295.1 hypothetical protein [Clostridium botulinum]
MNDAYVFKEENRYEKYCETVNIGDINANFKPKEFIEKFIKSNYNIKKINLNYTVFLGTNTLENGKKIDYYYKPYIILEKDLEENYENSVQKISMADMKIASEEAQIRKNDFIADYTYTRAKSDIRRSVVEYEENPLLVKIIDNVIYNYERKFMRELKIISIESFFNKIVQEGEIEVKNIYNTYVKIHNTSYYKEKFRKIPSFKISRIGMEYFYSKY